MSTDSMPSKSAHPNSEDVLEIRPLQRRCNVAADWCLTHHTDWWPGCGEPLEAQLSRARERQAASPGTKEFWEREVARLEKLVAASGR